MRSVDMRNEKQLIQFVIIKDQRIEIKSKRSAKDWQFSIFDADYLYTFTKYGIFKFLLTISSLKQWVFSKFKPKIQKWAVLTKEYNWKESFRLFIVFFSTPAKFAYYLRVRFSFKSLLYMILKFQDLHVFKI